VFSVKSEKAIGRLSLYRRLLQEQERLGLKNIYSHDLAKLAGVTAAQLRRDIMAVGYLGRPNMGYNVIELQKSISHFLEDPQGDFGCLVGVGNLGRAILAYVLPRRPSLQIVAGFDVDPSKTNRIIQNCRCYPLEQMEQVLREKAIRVGVITVPASEAQAVADTLVRGGVRGIVNFAPVTLRLPVDVYVENIDMARSMEIAAYFAQQLAKR